MTKSKRLTFKLFRGRNVSASRGAKNEKSISEACSFILIMFLHVVQLTTVLIYNNFSSYPKGNAF